MLIALLPAFQLKLLTIADSFLPAPDWSMYESRCSQTQALQIEFDNLLNIVLTVLHKCVLQLKSNKSLPEAAVRNPYNTFAAFLHFVFRRFPDPISVLILQILLLVQSHLTVLRYILRSPSERLLLHIQIHQSR